MDPGIPVPAVQEFHFSKDSLYIVQPVSTIAMTFIRCCDNEKCIVCRRLIGNEEEGCKVTVPAKRIRALAAKTKLNFKIPWDSTKATNFAHYDCWVDACSRTGLSASEKRILSAAKDTVERFSSLPTLISEVDKVVQILVAKTTKQVVCFTGAGISASAGIPTYRGADGIDTLQALAGDSSAAYTSDKQNNKRKVVDLTADEDVAVATPSTAGKKAKKGGKQEIQEVQEESQDEEEQSEDEEDVDYTKLQPTYAHLALAKMETLNKLHGCITQNCDNLHAKAGVSAHLISDLHGNVFKEYCVKCLTEYERDYAVDQYSTDCSSEPWYKKCDTCGWNHYTGRLCDTGRCKGKLCDTIVNFGDDLHQMLCGGLWRASRKCRHADLCLALGTSLTVYPASELPLKAKQLVIVNLQATDLDGDAAVRVWATCDGFFRLLMPRLEAALQEQKKPSLRASRGGGINGVNKKQSVVISVDDEI